MPISEDSLRRIVEDTLAKISPQSSHGEAGLCLSLAVALSKGCAAKAEALGVPVSVSVVDASGVPILFNRLPGALLVSVEIAPKKAYTCVSLNMSTEEAGAFVGKQASGLDVALEGKIVLFAGGLPIRINGVLVGGLGVSGGTPAQDKEIAESGLRAAGLLS